MKEIKVVFIEETIKDGKKTIKRTVERINGKKTND